MWLHSTSSLIGKSVGLRVTLSVTWLSRIPIGMAGDDKGFEKLEVSEVSDMFILDKIFF